MAIHGNKSQSARTKALAEFKDGSLTALVATDIAARGIDIDQLPHVVNYDLPNVPEDYVHRIGRTGRAGATGEAVSLVCVDEHEMLKDIEKLIKQTLPRAVIPGFEPDLNARAQPVQLRSGGPGHRNGGGGGGRNGGGGRGKPAAAGAKTGGGGGGGGGGNKPRAPGGPMGGNGGGPRTGGNAPRAAAQHRSGGRGR
jgi:ATP-dependent RNA helicase RhlE